MTIASNSPGVSAATPGLPSAANDRLEARNGAG